MLFQITLPGILMIKSLWIRYNNWFFVRFFNCWKGKTDLHYTTINSYTALISFATSDRLVYSSIIEIETTDGKESLGMSPDVSSMNACGSQFLNKFYNCHKYFYTVVRNILIHVYTPDWFSSAFLDLRSSCNVSVGVLPTRRFRGWMRIWSRWEETSYHLTLNHTYVNMESVVL